MKQFKQAILRPLILQTNYCRSFSTSQWLFSKKSSKNEPKSTTSDGVINSENHQTSATLPDGYKDHVPVLVKQCCDLLSVQEYETKKKLRNTFKKTQTNMQVFIDATFGAGGYSRQILRTYPNAKVVAIDTDYYNNPIIQQQEKLIHEEFGKERLEVHCVNFRDLKQLVEEKVAPKLNSDTTNVIDGIVFDLGVSSMQLDHAHRGFSFLRDGPLGK